ncbi:MerR family transcriptional regulator [Rhodocyclus tenuis]|uniref:Helix-turn-helix domain-containing protein n=1 Tax=Rhodocyclus tenuis TaxID=1066 RepID=A0A840GB11_RHOTE|nr:helix-turn-helix domain-containing protein [Rhodocyclus tenuis]MBB4249036.1 hypothetical protein [Rhodocyclus tenuis]
MDTNGLDDTDDLPSMPPPMVAPSMLQVTTLRLEHVAKILQCDRETACRRLAGGDLPGLKFGRSWIVPAAAFYQRINELAIEQAAERKVAGRPAPMLGSASDPPPRRRGRERFRPTGF